MPTSGHWPDGQGWQQRGRSATATCRCCCWCRRDDVSGNAVRRPRFGRRGQKQGRLQRRRLFVAGQADANFWHVHHRRRCDYSRRRPTPRPDVSPSAADHGPANLSTPTRPTVRVTRVKINNNNNKIHTTKRLREIESGLRPTTVINYYYIMSVAIFARRAYNGRTGRRRRISAHTRRRWRRQGTRGLVSRDKNRLTVITASRRVRDVPSRRRRRRHHQVGRARKSLRRPTREPNTVSSSFSPAAAPSPPPTRRNEANIITK